MQTITKTCESKYGFHPCDYETILKLKETHRLLLRAYRDVKRFISWDNKLPHNRKGERPKCPPNLIDIGPHKLDKHWFYGRGFISCKDQDNISQNLYLHVLHQYEKARRPKPNAHAVEMLDLPDNLDKIVEKLKEFYGE